MRRPWLVLVWLIAALAPLAAQAQTPFRMRAQDGDNVSAVAPGSTLSLNAQAIGTPALVRVTMTYIGSTRATITNAGLIGSTALTVSTPTLPASLDANQEFGFTVRYSAVNSQRVSGQLLLEYLQQGASGEPGERGSVLLNVVATAPEFIVAYSVPPDSNVLTLPSGGQIAFPPTQLGSNLNIALAIINRGSGPGEVQSVTLGGDSFTPLGLPLLPASVSPGAELRFSIRFTPRRIGEHTGSLSIALSQGSFTAGLAASGGGSAFAYEVVRDGAVEPVPPGQGIAMPEVDVGATSTVAVRVRNSGNGDGQVTAITVPLPFQVSDLPPLPATLPPNASLAFTLSFTPTEARTAGARLRVGNETINLSGVGLGALLELSYTSESSSTVVPVGGSVVFPPAQIGQSSSSEFTIRNRGTRAGTLTSVSIGEAQSAYTLEGSSALPLTLEPDQAAAFRVVFRPSNLGATTGSLRVNAASFVLSGAATPPPPLPEYRIEGPSGAVQPLEQPALSLHLAEPYPVAVTGSLTVSFNSEAFSADPALQFSTGGTAVPFTIPANGTEAVFINGSPSVRLQAGTVAGTIVLTPSFAVGGFNLTPSDPAGLRLTMARSAPQLLSGEVVSVSTTGATVVVSGYSTLRSLRQLAIQFELAPNAPANVPTTRFTVDIAAAAGTWFRSTASAATGGLFSASVPFTFQGTTASSPAFAEVFQSITVTATNESGDSNSVSISLR